VARHPGDAVLSASFVAPLPLEDPEKRHASELSKLRAEVAAWREKYPGVEVECIAVDGHAAEALTKASTAARLVVVGTRGHGGFAGLLLGSGGTAPVASQRLPSRHRAHQPRRPRLVVNIAAVTSSNTKCRCGIQTRARTAAGNPEFPRRLAKFRGDRAVRTATGPGVPPSDPPSELRRWS
jgi:Universal stress protein family